MILVNIGDYNLNNCKWTDDNIPRSNQTYKLRNLISALFSRIIPYGVAQLISGPTRYFPGQKPSGLDHFYSNRPEKITHIQKFHCGGSDHMLILVIRKSKSIKNTPKYIRKRNYKHFDSQAFISEVRKIKWLELYMSDDVDEALGFFMDKFKPILDRMAPMRNIQIKTNYNPWISQDTLSLMKERDKLQKDAAETSDKNIWDQYKKMRN